MDQTALILGQSGRFGHHAARAFVAAGWRVRRFVRDRDDLHSAAAGADVIVNGWNPPYPDWAAHLPGLTGEVIAAARASGATILQAANMYVYGAAAPPRITADTPNAAENPLGRLRIEAEIALKNSGVQVFFLRAGDFLDTRPSGNWFDRIMIAKTHKGRFVYPGAPDIPHAWAYLPDLAEAAVALAERREGLGRCTDILFPGNTLTGRDLAETTARALGRPLSLRIMSWLPISLARPVWPMAKHLIEMRYLWNMPHEITDTRLARLAPDLRRTPLDRAVARAVEHKVHPDKAVA